MEGSDDKEHSVLVTGIILVFHSLIFISRVKPRLARDKVKAEKHEGHVGELNTQDGEDHGDGDESVGRGYRVQALGRPSVTDC